MNRLHQVGSVLLGTVALLLGGCHPAPPKFAPPPPPLKPMAIDPELTDEARQELLMDAASHDPFMRANAIEALGDVSPAEAVEPATRGLTDSDAPVRFAAAMVVGKLGLASEHDALAAMAQDPDLRVEAAVRFALHKLGDVRLSHDLEKLAANTDPHVRSVTAQVLGELGEPSATGLLAHMLGDTVPAVRLQAAEALWLLRDQRGLDALTGALLSAFPDDEILAITALGESHDSRVMYLLDGKLNNEYPEVNLATARALGMMGSDTGYREVIWGAQQKDPRRRALAALGMGAIGRVDFQPWLAKLLKDSDPNVRLAAATGMLQLREPQAEP